MLGWMIVFALIAILNAIFIFLGPSEASPRVASTVFFFLFVVFVLSRAVRSRVW